MNKNLNLFLEPIAILIFYAIAILVIWLKGFILSPTEIRDFFAVSLFVIFWFGTTFIIKLLRFLTKELRKNTKINEKISKRFKVKPLIYEYCFFLSLFWATGFFTVAYSINITNVSDFLVFAENFALSIGVFGMAAAFGWEHYIESSDK